MIQLPTLSERKDDIGLLATHFIGIARKSLNKNIEGLADDVTKGFLEYPWPGNVRELRNAIQYACALCHGDTIQREDLPPEIFSEVALKQLSRRKTDPGKEGHQSHRSEKDSILAMLEMTGWNKAKAARRLGISRATLYSKLLKYGIESPI